MNFKNEQKEKDYEEQNSIENNEEQEENSINVYDDNAYMLGEDDSDNNSLDNLKNNENENINNNNNYKNEKNTENDINNKIQEKKLNLEIQNEIQGLDEVENENEEYQENQINQESNNYLKNEEQKVNNQNKNNININSNNNKKIDVQKIIENNNNNIRQENENAFEEGEQQDEEDEEENLPLVTLKNISVCQCCKNPFDSTNHLPYLFKCGHFFCKECIEEQFTDEEGIKCPIDGLVAQTFKDFKLLNNLITDKTIPSQRNNKNKNSNNNLNNTCKIHKGQKLTHIVDNTKEIVCVYCAFDLVRKNPNCEVRELKEKFEEFKNKAEKIININQNNVEIIQKSLKDIKDNKNNEEKKINFYFEHILKYISTKKEEILSKIDSIFTANATKLSQKLENFSIQIELGENLKSLIDEYNKNNTYGYNDIYESYLKLESLNEAEKNNKVNLQEYKFIHDDETKMIKYINNFGDIKSIYKYIPFQDDIKDIYELNNIIEDNDYEQINNDKNYTIKRNMVNNNNYNINNLNPNESRNKSFILTNKRDNINILDENIGNNINNSYYNNNYIPALNNNNNNYSKYNLRINTNPKKFFNCSNYQKIKKCNSNNNIQINKNIINENNSNLMNYNLNMDKGKSYKTYQYTYDNNNTKYLNSTKSINSKNIYTDNKRTNLDSFHRISSPGNYKYDFKRINK